MPRVYLDNNATTPIDPRVLDAMMPYFREKFGNAASRSHSFGHEAEEAVGQAREQLAGLIGATAKEIIWTSGATESDNIAVKGVARMYKDRGNHIITQKTEHKAVLDPAMYLEQQGFEVTYLEPDADGRIRLEELEQAFTDKTTLVSIMLANNETGTVQPVAEIGKMCKERGVIFHTDGAQAVGKIPVDVEKMGIDLLSCSGHKMYAPKGVGALYVRRKNPRVRLETIMHGGGHERGMRSGTLNVPSVVGMGVAAEIAAKEMDAESARIGSLRDRLWEGLCNSLTHITRNGDHEHCLPNTANISFSFVEGESLMMAFSDIAVSSGSACTSASLEPSYVLKAMGIGDDLAHTSIRFSLGRFTTSEEIDYTVERVTAGVNHLREMSPLYEMAQEGVDIASINWKA